MGKSQRSQNNFKGKKSKSLTISNVPLSTYLNALYVLKMLGHCLKRCLLYIYFGFFRGSVIYKMSSFCWLCIAVNAAPPPCRVDSQQTQTNLTAPLWRNNNNNKNAFRSYTRRGHWTQRPVRMFRTPMVEFQGGAREKVSRIPSLTAMQLTDATRTFACACRHGIRIQICHCVDV